MNKTTEEVDFLSTENKAKLNFSEFKIKSTYKLLILSLVLFCLLLFSVFKNISYPLFWADESMTAIGTERVLEFGYPKVHDGKNVFYDLRHSNPTLGISEKNDAYVGGAGWGQYYFGIIGYKLAETTSDYYFKTGVFRTTFAVAGLLGLLILAFFVSRVFPDKFSKYLFFTLFLLMELSSVSLALLLREVRYYSLVIILSGFIIGMYSFFRFYKPFNKFIFIGLIALALWLLYVTFAPTYFIVLVTIVISELGIGTFKLYNTSIKIIFKDAIPIVLALFASVIGVVPLLYYFKTFEISKAMSEFNGYSSEMYWFNVSVILRYFRIFEYLLLALVLKAAILIYIKKLFVEKSSLFRVSNFLTLFFIVSVFLIAKIPNFIYTRYIIYLQPILVIIIILDLFSIINQISQSKIKFVNVKLILPVAVFLGFYCYNIVSNIENIKGHIYEMTHIYKGSLDFTIPFIKEKFQKTDTLIIAANYEETSYMYYLKSKVIIGYVGNNLAEDFLLTPQVIAYRKPWQNHVDIFNRFVQKAPYQGIVFPVLDYQVNNYAELNYNFPEFNFYMNHQFQTRPPSDQNNATDLFVRK